MNNQVFLGILQGRLFQLMVMVISAAVLSLSAASLYLTFSGFNSLQQDVTQDLHAGQLRVDQTLRDNLVQVSGSVINAKQDTVSALSEYLKVSMEKELSITGNALHDSLLETANSLTTMLAEVAPEAILGNKFDTLVGYTKVANRNQHVIYAVYIRPDGRPFTRYVNRNNPIVVQLLAAGEGGIPLDRLISAAAVDPSIREITKEIRFEDKVIGQVRLGFSVTQMNSQMAEMRSRFDTLINDSHTKTESVLQSEVGILTGNLEKNFQLVNQHHAELTQAAEAKIQHSAQRLIWSQIISTIIVGFVILLGLCLFFVMRVIQPLNRLFSAMQDIAEGDGDLTQRLPENGNDEIFRVAAAFNLFVRKIQKALAHAGSSTSQLSSATDVLAKIARQSNESVNTQQLETHQVASAITQMAQAVKEISRNAAAATVAAQEANNEASVGKQVMLETGMAINTLASEVNEAARVINQLETESESIGSVLDVIRGIADQTNLLALNAAIEAARAGEQGRGFAVVADEVRTLASRTQESTSEIHHIIESLQTGTRNAAQVMNSGLSTTRETVEKAGRAGMALENIAASIATITTINTRIAEASEEHTRVAEDIDRRVERISQLSKTATRGSTETAQKSQELAHLGDELQGLVAQFKV